MGNSHRSRHAFLPPIRLNDQLTSLQKKVICSFELCLFLHLSPQHQTLPFQGESVLSDVLSISAGYNTLSVDFNDISLLSPHLKLNMRK